MNTCNKYEIGDTLDIRLESYHYTHVYSWIHKKVENFQCNDLEIYLLISLCHLCIGTISRIQSRGEFHITRHK